MNGRLLMNGRGRNERPSDGVERAPANDGVPVFEMNERARRAFGSRRGGKRVRAMIENSLGENRSVTLDFQGVGVFSSGFADEVFGRLFVEMGPTAFMARVKMLNVDPTVSGLIDRAIEQRARHGNGKPGA